MIHTKTLTTLTLAMTVLASTAHASLIGDPINAEYFRGSNYSVHTQFTSPAVVGAGVEFTGQAIDFSTILDFALDFDADSFTLTISGPDAPISDVGAIVISDLDWLPQPGVLLNVVEAGTNPFGVEVYGVTGDSFTLGIGENEFTNIDGEPLVYEFDLITEHVVPEPASAALLAAGGLALMRRRKH